MKGDWDAVALRSFSAMPSMQYRTVKSRVERKIEKRKSTYGRELETSAVVSSRIDDPLPRMLERVSSSSK